jgi:hypothetical protein
MALSVAPIVRPLPEIVMNLRFAAISTIQFATFLMSR